MFLVERQSNLMCRLLCVFPPYMNLFVFLLRKIFRQRLRFNRCKWGLSDYWQLWFTAGKRSLSSNFFRSKCQVMLNAASFLWAMFLYNCAFCTTSAQVYRKIDWPLLTFLALRLCLLQEYYLSGLSRSDNKVYTHPIFIKVIQTIDLKFKWLPPSFRNYTKCSSEKCVRQWKRPIHQWSWGGC